MKTEIEGAASEEISSTGEAEGIKPNEIGQSQQELRATDTTAVDHQCPISSDHVLHEPDAESSDVDRRQQTALNFQTSTRDWIAPTNPFHFAAFNEGDLHAVPFGSSEYLRMWLRKVQRQDVAAAMAERDISTLEAIREILG